MSVGLVRLGSFEVEASEGFVAWLAEHGVSILFGRADNLMVVGRHDDELRVDPVTMPAVGGLAVDGRRLVLSNPFQVWSYDDGLAAGTTTDSGHDAVLLPYAGVVVGGAGVIDIGLLADGSVVMASPRFSCLSTPIDGMSFRPLWMPRWVSALRPDERSPVSGVGVRDGVATTATLLACGDGEAPWREGRATSGAVVDVVADEVVANGLAMPSSPRWHDGRLWFTQSGTGELCTIDSDDSVVPVVGLPTFLRGLAFVGPYAVVGGSGSRWDSLVEGLPIDDRLAAGQARPEQGLWVVDTRSGEVVHRLEVEGTGREVHSIAAYPARRPQLFSPTDNELQTLVAYDASWDPDVARASFGRP